MTPWQAHPEEPGSGTAPDLPARRRELISRLRKIGIVATRKTTGLISGSNTSLRKGGGIEFADLREYVPGDEIRSIDWNVTARTNRLYVREHYEDRDRTVYFLLDFSGSCDFGSDVSIRRQVCDVGASLIFSSAQANDSTGLLLFTDRVEAFVPARKGRKHVAGIFNTIIACEPASRGTDLSVPLRFLSRTLRRGVTIVIVSDFNCPDFTRDLSILSKRHEVIAIRVTDPHEHVLPDVGFIVIEDPETGGQLLVDTGDPGFRERFAARMKESERSVRAALAAGRAAEIPVLTTEPFDRPITRFFRGRNRGRVHGRVL